MDKRIMSPAGTRGTSGRDYDVLRY